MTMRGGPTSALSVLDQPHVDPTPETKAKRDYLE